MLDIAIREYFTSEAFGRSVGSYKRKYVWSIWLTYISKQSDAQLRQLYRRFYLNKPLEEQLTLF